MDVWKGGADMCVFRFNNSKIHFKIRFNNSKIHFKNPKFHLAKFANSMNFHGHGKQTSGGGVRWMGSGVQWMCGWVVGSDECVDGWWGATDVWMGGGV